MVPQFPSVTLSSHSLIVSIAARVLVLSAGNSDSFYSCSRQVHLVAPVVATTYTDLLHSSDSCLNLVRFLPHNEEFREHLHGQWLRSAEKIDLLENVQLQQLVVQSMYR